MKRASARIAVVIPCYNDGSTLREAFESVRLQEPTELVVVDDGSDDPDTLARLMELEGEGLTVLRQQNSGPGSARMTGVRQSSARYVFPLDADDRLVPGALTALADALDRDPEATAAWGDIRMFGDIDSFYRSGTSIDPWRITYLNSLPVSALIRRDRLIAAGGWPLASEFEDWDLWMTFAERGWRGIYVRGPVHIHRVHGPRRMHSGLSRYDVAHANLRARHQTLFARRRRNWRGSTARPRERFLFPLVEALPVSQLTKLRLDGLIADPGRLIREKASRVGRRLHPSRR